MVDDLNAEGNGSVQQENRPVEQPPPQPAQPPARQPLGPANAETTPAGAPAAVAVRTQRPDAARGGKNG